MVESLSTARTPAGAAPRLVAVMARIDTTLRRFCQTCGYATVSEICADCGDEICNRCGCTCGEDEDG